MTGLVLPFQPPATAVPPAQPGMVAHVNGIVPVIPMHQLLAEEKARAATTQNTPLITGLAAHVRSCFTAALDAKRMSGIEERLNQCVRQRRGVYDPSILSAIQAAGTSEIYMMLSANKCRAAASWIKDVMLGTRGQAPWDVEATAEPSLDPQLKQDVVTAAAQEAMQVEASMGVDMMNEEAMRSIVQRIADTRITQLKDAAERKMDLMRSKMTDQLQEGGYTHVMDSFIDDLVTFPYAVVKGPVPRNHMQLKWVPGPDGQFTPECVEEIQLDWDRVDPFKLYWAPHSTHVDDGFLIEHHELTCNTLSALIGVEGYKEDAIRGVLDDYGKGGLRNWMLTWNSTDQATAEGKSMLAMMTNPDATIDALQFWGHVQGKMLVEWGMDAKLVEDPLKSYDCEVWVIGQWVIKAALNANPLGKKPYYKTSYEKIPGSFAGNGVCDLVRDTQTMCNAAARALSNNMGIASGPMVWINTQRLAVGEDVTQMYPWRLYQGVSDPYGSGSSEKPIEFFQPNSNALELMGIYEKFSTLADEYSGVPRYMTGDSPAGGAGRTASGMSMLMNNAGKSIKQVIGNIDMDVTAPLIERLYYTNMKYSDDPELKGDVRVVARGVNVLVAKEAAQLRMGEILQIVSNSEMLIGIVGEEAVANLLREITKPLNMDIVPDKEVIRARMIARQQQAIMMQIIAAKQQEAAAKQQAAGAPSGKKTISSNKQALQDGSPITDNFQPARRG